MARRAVTWGLDWGDLAVVTDVEEEGAASKLMMEAFFFFFWI